MRSRSQDIVDPRGQPRRSPSFGKVNTNVPQVTTEGPGRPGELGTLLGAWHHPCFTTALPELLGMLGILCTQGHKGYRKFPACRRGRPKSSLPYETQRKAPNTIPGQSSTFCSVLPISEYYIPTPRPKLAPVMAMVC